MSKLVRTCVMAAASAGLLALAPAAASAAEECRDFAAVGSGLNDSIAGFMALQGAVNVAENRGWTVKGDAKLVGCKAAGTFGTECTAKSHACRRKN
jgi:hypothetical protein